MPIGLIPAAGRSRRMGRPKALLPWGETTVLGATIAALRGGGASTVVVVVPAGAEAVAETARRAGARTVVNRRPERGMLSSIWEGLDALPDPGALLLVCPLDHPALSPGTVRALVAALRQGAALALPVHAGRRGHPLAVAPDLVPEIRRLDPRRGLRELVEARPELVVEVPVHDPGCVRDVDTPGDYEELRPAGS